VQLYIADGLSTAAIEHNLRDIFPVIQPGLQQAGLKMGTPFYVKYGRVGLMNDVNSVVDAKVVVTLIGERPGLGRAEAMSAYLGYKPGSLPHTEKACAEVLSVPLFPEMSRAQVLYAAYTLLEAVASTSAKVR